MTIALARLPATPEISSSDAARWAAVETRDRASDGAFFYAVRTTGVYCRPSCGARRPLRANVEFHATAQDAERAGFRPCKRCRPDRAAAPDAHAAEIAAACRRIESDEETPSLSALAADSGLSPFHFHRLFKAATGLTPKNYARGRRSERVRQELGRGGSVTSAIYGAGFNSSSRFYEASAAILGMAPKTFQAGGDGAAIRFALGQCSLGAILVAATDKGVCAIALGDDPEALLRQFEDRFPKAQLVGGDRDFECLVARVVGMVETPGTNVDLPLDIRGTAFQQRVWRALRAIPAGQTLSYSALAARIGAPKSARAVARACATNELAIVIPCHRVVHNDGTLSGYRWGVERKRRLLDREGQG